MESLFFAQIIGEFSFGKGKRDYNKNSESALCVPHQGGKVSVWVGCVSRGFVGWEIFVDIRIEQDGGVTVASILATYLDASNASELFEAVRGCLVEGRHLLLDCSELSFLDSTGLHVLAQLLEVSRSNRSSMSLCGVNRGASVGLDTLRVGESIPIFPTRKEALDLWTLPV